MTDDKLRAALPTTSRELFHGHHPECGWTVDADPKACDCVVILRAALAASAPDGWWHPKECTNQHDEGGNCLDADGSIVGWREER